MRPVIYGRGGMPDVQIDDIERALGFRLPSDFRYLLANMQDKGGVFFPWAQFDIRKYRERLDEILQGIEWSLERDFGWLDRWGEKPRIFSDALDFLREDFKSWPKLLPLHSHRFLVAEPCEPGNPVLSIKGTDIIYYGTDLAHYLLNEFVDHSYEDHVSSQTVRHIPIWSDYVERKFS
jgi:hypothetical protein